MRQVTRAAILLLALGFAGAAQATPRIQHWKTDNGAAVYFVPTHDLPIIDIRILFDAGSAREGSRHGLAELTNGLLADGAGGLDATTLAQRFENHGARFSSNSGRDSAQLSLRSLSRPEALQAAIDNLALILGKPDFPEQAFKRELARMQVGLNARGKDPGSLATEAFYKALYGSHPYAGPPHGTRESLATMKPAMVKAFYARYYVAHNATIAIVGDLDRDRARTIAAQLTARLKAGAAPPPLPPVPPLTEATTVRVKFDSQQSHIMIGQPLVARGGEDYFALYVGNHVLGGNGLVSMLADRMREQRGLSYSSYSAVVPMARKGPFEIASQVVHTRTAEAVGVLTDALQDLRDNGPDPERLKSSKENITGSFPLNLDSNRDIVSYIAMIGFYHLPLDYLERFRDRVSEVTERDVHNAFRKHLDPDHMVTVIVGPEK